MHFDIPEEVQTGGSLDRAIAADRLYTQVTEYSSEIARLRREAIEQALNEGHRKVDVARALDLHPTRVGRIVSAGPAPERAVLSPDGTGVKVALGSKESDVGGKPSDMISRDAAEAYDTIRAAAEGFGLSCTREVVAAPGLVELNRAALVVMGSPKVLPLIGQVLASDSNYGFDSDEDGRYLIDHVTDEIYRSPQDTGTHADYGYLGRLPRPDGHGTFLYIAGIHAAGTHGAAKYLIENLADIYQTVRQKPFSVLVRCDYDGDNRERGITGAAAASEIRVR